METYDIARWKNALFSRRRAHALFIAFFVAANACYFVGSVIGAALLIGLGLLIELAAWLVLGADSDEPNQQPRGGWR